MTRRTDDTNPTDDRPTRSSDDASSSSSSFIGDTSRRDFLKTTAGASALATGLGSGLVGSAAAKVIDTPPLHVDGNLVKDPDGATVKIRGVNIADPKRINVTSQARGKTAEQVVSMLTDTSQDWHSRAIRIPVQPVDIGEHPPGQGPSPPAFTQSQLESYLTNHLDPLIEHCLQRGTYAIIDYHRHRDIQWTNTSLHDEIDMFWDTVAPRYADSPHVMYEVYNEPQEPGMWGDPTQSSNWADVWSNWKSVAQPWVDTIRSYDPNNLVLIGSPSWTQSPEGALVEPFDGNNLAYTYHIYPGHSVSAESCHCWDDATTNGEGVANVYEEYPLFVTEFGWEQNGGEFIGGTDTFGTAFLDWLEGSDGIHWTAWCGDPVWRPVMFDRPFADNANDSLGDPYSEEIPTQCSDLPCDWSLTTGSGYMGDDIKDALYSKRNDNPPTVAYDQQAPPTPSDLSASGVTETTVDLSWSAVTDAGEAGLSHYNVYVDGTKQAEVAQGATSTTVTGLTSDTSYTIGVAAVDRARNVSSTATAQVTTDVFEDSTPPAVPSNLSSPAKTYRSVTVSWDPSTDSGDAETAGLDHYNVYVDGSLHREVPSGTTQVQIGDLDSDTAYEFGVSAVDRAANESTRATVSVTTDLARAGPDDLLINDYDGDPAWPGQNDLGNWTDSSGFESVGVTDGALQIDYNASGWYGTQVSQDITDYPSLKLKVAGESGGEESHIELEFGGVSTMLSEVTSDSIGTQQSIVSVDLEAAGVDLAAPGQLTMRFYNGGDSSIAIEELWLDGGSSTTGDATSPTTPTNLASPTQTDTSVDVSWDASSDSGGSGLDHYNVSVDGTVDQQVAAGTTSATIASLSAGTSYEVGVSAVDGAGNESSMATMTVTTSGGDGEAPTVPSNLTSPAQTATSVELDWDASSDTDGSGLDHYVVSVDGTQDHTVAAGTTSTTVTGLSAGTSYDVGVSAVDGAGNESAQATATVSTADSDDATAPTTPSNLSVTGTTSSSVDVSWDASPDSGGSGLSHYNVYLDGSMDHTVAAGTTSTTADGLAADTSYEVGVSAVDGAGNESPVTAVTATTDADVSGDALLINDYDGSPAWSSNQNDLGQWCGAGSFQNGGGEVVDGALRLEYDNGGWLQEQINQDVSGYSTLVLGVRGANGGEESEVLFDMGGVRTMLANVTSDSIGTSAGDVAVDLEAAGVDRTSSSLSVRLNFWQGGSSTLSIEEIRLE